jgi:hypothetical protein
VLKKAGIVLAIATSGALALSPLAFAGDYEGDDGHGHHHAHHSDWDDRDSGGGSCRQANTNGSRGTHGQSGLINLQDNNVQVPIQACNNSVIEGVLGILSAGQSNQDAH